MVYSILTVLFPLLSTLCLTGHYYAHFYQNSPNLLFVLCFIGGCISLFFTLPLSFSGKKFDWIIYIFIPFFALFSLTYNLLFALFAIVLSITVCLFITKKFRYTKILFTQDNTPVFVHYTKRRKFTQIHTVFGRIFSALTVIVFVITSLMPFPTNPAVIKAFPVNLSKKEVLEGPVYPSGLVTSTAWYDENALLVASFNKIVTENGEIESPALKAGMLPGDIIVKINAEKALLSDFIVKGSDGSEVTLTVKRMDLNGHLTPLTFKITPVYSPIDKKPLIGINYYSAATVGASVQTLSFSYPSTGYFAATAHSSDDIYDDTSSLLGLLIASRSNGRDVTGLTVIPEDAIGLIIHSNNYGSYGILDKPSGEAVEIATKSDVHLGKATLLSSFEGGEITEYEVFVTGTYRIDNRDVICIAVTDKRIVEKGGITRGMSGSPIIQNGKLIGALSNMDSGGYSAYATYAYDMAHEIYLLQDKLSEAKK